MKRKLLLFGGICLLLILMVSPLMAGCAKPSPAPAPPKDEVPEEDVVAIVDGVEITKDEFIQRLRAYIQSNESQMRKAGEWQKANETEEEFVQRFIPLIGKNVLEGMILEILIEQKAKEQNITVKPEEIDKKIDELKPKPTAEDLSKMGMTIEELRQQVESQILMEKIVSKAVIVTEKEIRDHFERYKANFAKPEEIKASHILLRTEVEAKAILSQLKAGADFAELARRESIDPTTKEKGGDLGFFSRGKMTPAFEEAAFALEAGEFSEVVETPYGYHIIKVDEKKPAQEPNLELVREEIRETLTEQKTWTTSSNLLQNLREEAKTIEIRLPEAPVTKTEAPQEEVKEFEEQQLMEEYAEFTLTFPHEEKMHFQAKMIFVSERILGNVPYILIGLFGELPGLFEEFPSVASFDLMINEIVKIEKETGEVKGAVIITVKKPEVIPQKVIYNLEEDSLCGIMTAQGAYQIAVGEPYDMSFGGGTFYFKENNIIEGEIDAYYGGTILGKFRVKIREGVTIVGEKEE
ncbi:Foldase protein PrsA [subsurface metagenome]